MSSVLQFAPPITPRDAGQSLPAPLLELRGISKQFPGVKALDGVDLVLRPGRVTALVGENGAGKSTLVKILTGIEHPDAGEILIGGQACHLSPILRPPRRRASPPSIRRRCSSTN